VLPPPARANKRKGAASQSQKAEADEGTPAAATPASAAAADVSEGSPKKKARVTRVLTVTGLASSDKPSFLERVKKLGGAQVVEPGAGDDEWTDVTHVVCPTNDKGVLKRSEKLLVALARGLRVMDLTWVEQSAQQKRWLPEREWEWKTRCLDSDPLLPALQRWNPDSPHAGHAFAGWRVFVLPAAPSPKIDMMKKLLLFGGGVLVDESASDAELSTATHLLADTEADSPAVFKKSGGKLWLSVQAVLLRHAHPERLQVARANFIIEHLARLEPIDSFLLVAHTATTAGKKASQQASQGAAAAAADGSQSAKSSAAAKKSSQRSQTAAAAEDEEDDDEPMEVDRSVRQRRAIGKTRG
jgi:hypothetical protein